MNAATRMLVAKLNSLAEQGMTYMEAAGEVGATYGSVANYARRYDIPLKLLQRGRKLVTSDARSEAMRLLYADGQTLEQIGAQYGITRERVRQIMTKYHGIRAKDGGKTAVVRKARAAFVKKRDGRMMKLWGCSYKQYREILKAPGRPTYSFSQQRKNAQQRGIGWELTLWQWWMCWQQSGHWAGRGRGRAHQMCRLNDVGPYSVDNVYIASGTENMQDFWVNKRAADAQVAA